MANSYIGARSPKGTVGVRGVLDSGELSAYSAGVLSGFTAASAASWTLQIGGVSGVQDVAVAKNPGGESELLGGTAGQSIAFIIGGAPGTPGQSRTDALVLYKDPLATSVVNDGIDTVDYQVVAGTAATTGTQVPPNDAAIRAAIPTGSLKFVAVIGYVTIAYGAGSVTTAMFFKNPSLLSTQTVSNATELSLITPIEGQRLYQTDTDMHQMYDGANWLNMPRLLKKVTLTSAADTISVTGIPLRDHLHVKIYGKNSGTIACSVRFNNDSGTNYAYQSSYSGAAWAASTGLAQLTIQPTSSSEAYSFFATMDILNSPTDFKICNIDSYDVFGTNATTSLNFAEHRAKWASTAQINRFDLFQNQPGDLAAGSYVEIYG